MPRAPQPQPAPCTGCKPLEPPARHKKCCQSCCRATTFPQKGPVLLQSWWSRHLKDHRSRLRARDEAKPSKNLQFVPHSRTFYVIFFLFKGILLTPELFPCIPCCIPAMCITGKLHVMVPQREAPSFSTQNPKQGKQPASAAELTPKLPNVIFSKGELAAFLSLHASVDMNPCQFRL